LYVNTPYRSCRRSTSSTNVPNGIFGLVDSPLALPWALVFSRDPLKLSRLPCSAAGVGGGVLAMAARLMLLGGPALAVLMRSPAGPA
jgi:hypothetical protein